MGQSKNSLKLTYFVNLVDTYTRNIKKGDGGKETLSKFLVFHTNERFSAFLLFFLRKNYPNEITRLCRINVDL